MKKQNKSSTIERLIPSKKEITRELNSGTIKKLKSIINIRNIAMLILLISISIGVFGYLSEHGENFIWMLFNQDFYANISTELLSISITILVIDNLIRKRELDELREKLKRNLRSPDNAISLMALDELRANGWAFNGAIRGAHLLGANLKDSYLKDVDLTYTWLRNANFENAFMKDTKLHGAVLVGANFKNAKRLTSMQLSKAKMLLAATMPNGKRYDGRFNLDGDLLMAKQRDYNMNDPKIAAEFYGISLNQYNIGQKWSENPDVEDNDIFDLPEDWLSSYLKIKTKSL